MVEESKEIKQGETGESPTNKEKVEKQEEAKESKVEEKEEEKEEFFSKEKIYGILMAIAGVVVIVALFMFYQGFVDLFIKGIIIGIAFAAIALIIFGIAFAIWA